MSERPLYPGSEEYPDNRPAPLDEREERQMTERAVVRELHERGEYQAARFAWTCSRDMGGIGPCGLVDERGEDWQAYSVDALADDQLEAFREHRDDFDHMDRYDDSPMPEFREPDGTDLWVTASGQYSRHKAIQQVLRDRGLDRFADRLRWGDATLSSSVDGLLEASGRDPEVTPLNETVTYVVHAMCERLCVDEFVDCAPASADD